MKALILKSVISPNSNGLPKWQTEDAVFYWQCKGLIHLLAVVNWYLYFFIPKEKSAIFSRYLIKLSPSGHGCWKSHHPDWIHLTGSLNRPPVATNTIWSISDRLFGNLVREHDLGYLNSYWFPPAYTYVFFSLAICLSWISGTPLCTLPESWLLVSQKTSAFPWLNMEPSYSFLVLWPTLSAFS